MALPIKVLIKNQRNHPICNLALRITQDWLSKIFSETQNTHVIQPQIFTIIITDQKYNQAQHNSSVNLVIVVEGLQMGPAHMFALSEQLSTFGQNKDPFVPYFVHQMTIANCIAILIFQNLLSSLSDTNKNKIIKISCVDCLKYFGAFNITAKYNGMIEKPLGQNILDGGAPFYSIFTTKAGYLAVGNLQPKFYSQMVEAMGLDHQKQSFCLENQLNFDAWPEIRQIFKAKFLEKTAFEWETIMKKKDTCVTEIKEFNKNQNKFLHPILIKPKL